jgi:DNA repair exonuclease SbcCD ATPase subunit
MPDAGVISAIVNSLNAAMNITKAMQDLRDWSIVQSKVIELQQAILEAQNGIFAANNERSALIQRVRELEEEVTDLEAWEAEKKRYELKATGSGGLAYSIKPEAQGTEPPHKICARCYEHGKKSILQIKSGDHALVRLTKSKYECPECNTEIAF